MKRTKMKRMKLKQHSRKLKSGKIITVNRGCPGSKIRSGGKGRGLGTGKGKGPIAKNYGSFLERGDKVRTASFNLPGTYEGRGAKGYRVDVRRKGKIISVFNQKEPSSDKNFGSNPCNSGKSKKVRN